MNLDDRKMKVLAAIVEEYTKTGEPVGSHYLARLPGFNVSPATIRNEMAALFEMGLLEQPHTSAGRIPSHLGYRIYVDRLMRFKPLSKEEKDEIDALFNIRDPDPDKLLEDSAEALATLTNYATITSTSVPARVKVKRIQLIPTGEHTVVIVVIATNGVIRDKVARVPFTVTNKTIDFFNKFANSRLTGRTLEEITNSYISSVSMALGEYSLIFNPILTGIYELVRQIRDGQYYTGGKTNLLSYRELAEGAHDLLLILGRKEDILSMMEEKDPDSPVSVTIGKENTLWQFSNSSVLIARYDIGDDSSGAIGLVGPVRLDYARLIPHLEYFAKVLGEILSDTLGTQ